MILLDLGEVHIMDNMIPVPIMTNAVEGDTDRGHEEGPPKHTYPIRHRLVIRITTSYSEVLVCLPIRVRVRVRVSTS